MLEWIIGLTGYKYDDGFGEYECCSIWDQLNFAYPINPYLVLYMLEMEGF